MSDQDNDEFLAAARLGRAIDAERVGSPTVRLLLEEADREKDTAIDLFCDVNPTDAPKVAAIQVKMRAANLIGAWIANAIDRGRAAEEALPPPDDQPTE